MTVKKSNESQELELNRLKFGFFSLVEPRDSFRKARWLPRPFQLGIER